MKIASALLVFLGFVGVAEAAPARDALAGFKGLAFGTTFDAAKAQLGSEAVAGEDSANPPSKTLQTKERHFGEALSVQYVFANAGLFSTAVAMVEVPKDNVAFCAARWTGIVAQLKEEFGEPDLERKDALLGKIVFNFADGAMVRANQLGCSMYISFRSPSAAAKVQ